MGIIGSPIFAFEFVSLEEIIKAVIKLSIKKAYQTLDITVKTIKENKDLISFLVYINFNDALSSLQYPNGLKYAGVTPVFTNYHKSGKSNYRPISIPPNLAKVCELIMQYQIYPYPSKSFSKYQCGFRKGFSAQHSLIVMIEIWRQFLDSGGQVAAVLTDLLKAFNCINHELLIAK